MYSRFSIGTYIIALVLTIILFASTVSAFLLYQNRHAATLEDILANYHRATMLACTEIESELFRIEMDSHSHGNADPQETTTEISEADHFNPQELLALLERRVDTIVGLQQQYGGEQFQITADRLTTAIESIRLLLTGPSLRSIGIEILHSDELDDIIVRARQLGRMHASVADEFSESLQVEANASLRNLLVLIALAVVITSVITAQITVMIKSILARQREATEALRVSNERVQSILDTAAEAIITIDEAGMVQSYNKAAKKVFGYSAKEIVGKNVNLLMPSPHTENHDRYLQAYLTTGVKKIIGIPREVIGRRKDQSLFPMELSVSEFIMDGRPVFTGIVLDISERRALEEQLRHSQKMEAVGQLAGGIAHDFNNLLTAINGYADLLLEDDGITGDAREDLAAIHTAGKRAQELTAQLLAFSRKQLMRPQVVNLNSIVKNVDGMLRRLIGENIILETFLGEDLPNVQVDPAQVEQIIVNLAVNARDAMRTGGRLIIETSEILLDEAYTRDHPDAKPGLHVRLAVSDTGAGMSAETKARAFEPFFTTKKVGEGTGLGLSTVYGIVKQSEGSINLYSEEGQGTSFSIYFPSVDEDADEQAPPPKTAEAWMGSGLILLVEDDEDVRALAKRALTKVGYEVIDTAIPEKAIELADTRLFDLLLTDVIMPGLNGKEISDKISAAHPHIKVLYMSGYTDNAIVHHGVLDASVELLQKPFTPNEVTRRVRALLDA